MSRIIDIEEMQIWEKLYRTNLLNKLSGFKSAFLIGSLNSSKESNLAIFNSVSHIGANPFYLGFIVRPTSVERHTYKNIKETNYYTINHVNASIYKAAHQTSAKYDATVSEFDKCYFKEEYIDKFKAPFVKESSIKLGLTFVEEQLFRCNNTRMIIGKVDKIILPESCIEKNGHIRLDLLESVIVNGLDSYYTAYYLETLEFARP